MIWSKAAAAHWPRFGGEEQVAARGADWRAAYGQHSDGEPILDGKAITRSAPAGTLFKDAAHLPLMRVIAGGVFTMGAPASEADSHVSERPQRQIAVAGPFALGVYPLTLRAIGTPPREIAASPTIRATTASGVGERQR